MSSCSRWLSEYSKQDGAVITSAEVTKAGLPRRCLSNMVEEGKLTKVGRGIYMKPGVMEDEMYLLQLRFKNGIYSHETALYLHGLSDVTPAKYSMTFPFGYNTQQPKLTGINAKSMMPDRYALGQIAIDSPGGNKIRVFDIERTLCDIVRSRRRTDPRVIGEALREYLRWKQADVDKLLKYASVFKVDTRIRTYLEVLV